MEQADIEATAPRIIVAGGGSAEDDRPVLELFAAWTGTSGRVLYLPVALAGLRPYEDCLRWVSLALAPFRVSDITMWTDLFSSGHSRLAEFHAVFIGGGNTFSLLDQVRRSGFDTALERFVSGGGAVYGGSAGAILLGRDILTCAHLDENHVGLADTSGLDILGGYSVWCHYTPKDDAHIAEYVTTHGWPVLALSERSSLSCEGGTLTARGYEATHVFTADRSRSFPVGTEVPHADHLSSVLNHPT